MKLYSYWFHHLGYSITLHVCTFSIRLAHINNYAGDLREFNMAMDL